MKNRTYIAIDLKSFYASVECVERGLDPLTTNLVVADASRTKKLSASPSLPPSKHTAFPVGRGCLKSYRRSRKQMQHGCVKHQDEPFPAFPATILN